MAALTAQQSTIAGVVPTFTAVSASDTFPLDPSGKVLIWVKNGGASSDTVVIDSKVLCNQGTDHDGGSAVAAGAEKFFGPFETSRFDGGNGAATITHSFITSVTIAVIKL